MELLQALILGILQGVFEWLPVSSEGVISLTMTQLFGGGVMDSIHVAAWLHLGTMFAAIVYFRLEFYGIITGLPEYFFSARSDGLYDGEKRNITSFLILGTLVTAVVGNVVYLFGLKSMANRPDIFAFVMGVALLATGMLRFYRSEEEKTSQDLDSGDTLLTGLLQGLSVVPGISRSGSTVFSLFYRKFGGKEAFRLSFLLSVPTVLAANVGLQLFTDFAVTPQLITAALVSFLIGYLTIDILLRIADRAEVSYLCFALAALSFISAFLI